MDRVQSAERGGKRLRGSGENRPSDFHHSDPLEQLEDGRAPGSGPLGIDLPSKEKTINRPEAFDLGKHTRDAGFESAPFGKPPRFSQHDSQNH